MKPLIALNGLFKSRAKNSEIRNGMAYSSFGSGVIHSPHYGNPNANVSLDGFSSIGESISMGLPMPPDRIQKYACIDILAASPVVSAAVNLHITNALSFDRRTQRIVEMVPIDASDKQTARLCDEVNDQLLDTFTINALPNWAKLAALYGTSFIRPYAKSGKGITSIEFSYYTLPHFIYEVVRGAELAGFTGDYLRDPINNTQQISMPWDMVAFKLPNWTPNSAIQPIFNGSFHYSLLSNDEEDGVLSQTQNYGVSMLEHAWLPFLDLYQALQGLKAARNNAARIDRIIGLPTVNLNPADAAAYAFGVTQNLKRGADDIEQRMRSGQQIPTTLNHIIPVMGDGKNAVSIDTQQIPPDISGIEDVMFYLRQLCGAIGVDPTEIGWADQMSGGLGEGGWVATSGNSAQKSNWITFACANGLHRLIDIHCAYKYGKVFLSNRPYRLNFHSINTAIQAAQRNELESRANYALQVQSIMDMLTNNPQCINNEPYLNYIFVEQLRLDNDTAQNIIKALMAHTEYEDDEDDIYESVKAGKPANLNRKLKNISREALEFIIAEQIRG